MISAAFLCHTRRLRVLGGEMVYLEVGEGDPMADWIPTTWEGRAA